MSGVCCLCDANTRHPLSHTKCRTNQLTVFLTPESSTTPKYINSSTLQLINSKLKTQKLTNSKTHKFNNSPTQNLINPKSHQPKISSTQRLKLLPFILQYRSNFRSVLAKILVIKSAKSHYFYPSVPWGIVYF